MISLRNDTLCITFPQIARQVRQRVEAEIQKLASELPPVGDREPLLSEVVASRFFSRLSQAQQEKAREMVCTWTPEHVEGALRKAVLQKGGLNTDTFTELKIKIQRTLRIPDNGRTYSLPTGLGQIPLRFVEDFPETSPPQWRNTSNVILPLQRDEAVWFWFSASYHFAVKLSAGPLNLLTGESSVPGLQQSPQNYLTVPGPLGEPDREVVRRYVMPPLTESAMDAIQLEVIPMRAITHYENEGRFFIPPNIKEFFNRVIYCSMVAVPEDQSRFLESLDFDAPSEPTANASIAETSFKPLLKDERELSDWDQTQVVKNTFHPCCAKEWEGITKNE